MRMAALAATRALRHPVTILCLLVAAFFYKEIFLGRVFSPAGLANTILHMTIPLYAGLAMYLFASLLSQNRWARLFGAVAFALNGYSTVWLSSFVLPVIVATLPLILYLAIRFLRDGRMLH